MVKRAALGLLMAVGAVLVLALFILPALGLMKTYRAPSEAMVPEIARGDRFLVLTAGYEPEVGDIAVLHPPPGALAAQQCAEEPSTRSMCAKPLPGAADVSFIKRIVAGPGDKVRMEAGRAIVDGRPESGYPLGECEARAVCDFPGEIEIPAGRFFVLGDNRGASHDSRFWGPVPAENFVGRRLFTYWPG